MNEELSQNLKEGRDIYCLVLENKLETLYEKDSNFSTNNFLNLSLKNSLIKGLTQKIVNPYYKRNQLERKIEESFETNFNLGKLI